MTQSPSDQLVEADRLVQQAFQQWNTSLQAALQSLQRALSIYQEIGVRKAFPKKSREQKGSVFIAIGDVCTSLRQYSQALESYQQALEIAKEVGNRQGKGMALSGGGAVYQELGQYPQALSYYQQALDIAKEVGNRKEEGRILHGLGEILSKLEQYPKALDYYQQAVAVVQEIGDREAERRSLDAMRVIHDKLAHDPPTLGYSQQALSTRQAEANALRASEADRLFLQATKQYQTSQFQAAMQSFQKALEIYRKAGDRRMAGIAVNNIGTVYRALGEYPSALNCFQKALLIAQAVGDRAMEGTTLNNIGDVCFALGEYLTSINYYQKALPIFQEVDELARKGDTLNNIGAVYSALGQYPRALNYLQQALPIVQAVGARSMEGTIFNNIGEIYRNLGQYPLALQYYQQALPIAQAVDDRMGEGRNLNNIGLVYLSLGQYLQALNYFQQALLIVQTIGARSMEGTILCNIGETYHNLGQYSLALGYYQQSLSIVQTIGDPVVEGKVFNNIGVVYLSLGQYLQALNYCQQALAIWEKIGGRAEEGGTFNNIGMVYHSLGQYPKALSYFQRALSIQQSIGDRAGEGRSLNNIGTIYHKLGQNSLALDYCQQALSILQTLGARTDEGGILCSIGYFYYALEQYPQALDYYQRALSIVQAVNHRVGEGKVLSNIGRAHFELGQLEVAETSLMKALTVLDSLRQQDFTDDDKISLFDTQIGAYTLLQQVQIAQHKLEPALETAERGRARAFVDLLSRRISLEAVGQSSTVSALTIEQIKQTTQKQNATLVQYSIAYTPFRIDGKEEWRQSHLHIWAIKPTGEIAFRSVDLTTSETSLSSLIALSRETIGIRGRGYSIPVKPIRQPAQAKLQLQQLYQILIEPIADLLPTDSFDRIIFIPQGELFLVPFAALQDTHGSYLIQTHTILTAPSIQVLSLTRQLQRDRTLDFSKALIVGNPAMPDLPFLSQSAQLLPALPRAEQEAIAIAQKLQTQPLIGDAATETVVVQHMADASVIHLATHGLLEYGDPKASGVRDLPGAIVLACSEQDDGLLTSSKILNLKLRANLVVLSACDTGRGYITGDGVIGLSRALISAGASSVVVSLWKVADESTEELMVEFYRQLQQHTDKAQALRQAMLKTMQQYPDPIDWAAFTLIGEAE